MKKPRKQYTREFEMKAVRLLETRGKSTRQLEHEPGIGTGDLWRWKREFSVPQGWRHGVRSRSLGAHTVAICATQASTGRSDLGAGSDLFCLFL